MYLEYPISLDFCILSLIAVNSPKALYVNPGCLKCILGINISCKQKRIYFIHLITLLIILTLSKIILIVSKWVILKRVTTPTHLNSPPPTPTQPKHTSTYPHPPIKNVHLPPPSQNISPPTPTHPNPPIKNVHATPLTQNILPPTPTYSHSTIKNVHTPPPTQNIPPPTPTHPNPPI